MPLSSPAGLPSNRKELDVIHKVLPEVAVPLVVDTMPLAFLLHNPRFSCGRVLRPFGACREIVTPKTRDAVTRAQNLLDIHIEVVSHAREEMMLNL